MSTATPAIEVSVTTRYLRDESSPDQSRYAFSYTITLRNVGNVAARLLTRQWIVRDASGHSEEVRGDGVVGQHPNLQPGESFQYSSGAVIATPVGTMQEATAGNWMAVASSIPPSLNLPSAAPGRCTDGRLRDWRCTGLP